MSRKKKAPAQSEPLIIPIEVWEEEPAGGYADSRWTDKRGEREPGFAPEELLDFSPHRPSRPREPSHDGFSIRTLQE
jgi:hypothetical protein